MCSNLGIKSKHRIREPNSCSNINDFTTESMHIDWLVDFDSRQLIGNVILEVKAKVDNLEVLWLDSVGLTIKNVMEVSKDVFQQEKNSTNVKNFTFVGKKLEFGFCETKASLSEAKHNGLRIVLNTKINCDESRFISIEYFADENAEGAANWLTPEQTVGKRSPYLYTQCQSTYARSIVPCQDSPSIKSVYTSRVRVDAHLTALMSAICKKKQEYTVSGKKMVQYNFEQNVPIASYLLCLAVGEIESRVIGPRSKIWAEKEVVDDAAWEFADTENYLAAGEAICGPYVWGEYDLLVMPSSFPFGGMENPCLTFVTPTIISKDRSQCHVVAHEIAHSWMGNLVTNENWENFWLNEGFCVYLERRILTKCHSQALSDMGAIKSLHMLTDTIDELGSDHNYTRLVVSLEECTPDDAFTTVPYEKGFHFLRYLDSLVGGPEVFEKFLCDYVAEYSRKSIDSEQWKKYCIEYFEVKKGMKGIFDKVDWQSWLYGTGLPSFIAPLEDSAVNDALRIANVWIEYHGLKYVEKTETNVVSNTNHRIYIEKPITEEFKVKENELKSRITKECSISEFNSEQVVIFIDKLEDTLAPIPRDMIELLQEKYLFNETLNCAVCFAWQRLCLKSHYEDIYPHVVRFITSQGRMLYTRTLYRHLYRNSENGKILARETFLKFKSTYHSICSTMVSKDLELIKSSGQH